MRASNWPVTRRCSAVITAVGLNGESDQRGLREERERGRPTEAKNGGGG